MHAEDLVTPQPPMEEPMGAATAVAVAVPAVAALAENLEATGPSETLVSDENHAETEQTVGHAAPENDLSAWQDAAIPDVATLTAAKDAAAFVAQIFTDPSVSDAASGDVTAVEPADVQPEVVELPPVPVHWPQDHAQHLQGQRVLILGLGASGMAMARWCVRAGAAAVTVADTREAPPQLAQLQAQLPQVQFVGGALTAALVDGQSLTSVYRSPGLAPDVIAPVVDAARAIGLPVGGELDVFAAALQGLAAAHGYQPKVLAVTGTNGKTTVTSLTGQLLERAAISVAVAGNIGPTLLDTLSAHIDAQTLPQAWVLELSSFQLDGVRGFEPTAAVVLNLSQDHLDWHGSMQAYAAAKANIFGQQGWMVLNREDMAVMDMLPAPVKVKLQKPQLRGHVTFGADLPRNPGDYGIEVVAGMAWLVRAMEVDNAGRKSRDPQDDLVIQRLLPADALRIRGRHNATNALAALALAQAAGAPLAPMLYGLREYRGEPHRVEPIGIVHGVEYFDDSKGTNVGATVAALSGLGADRRIVLILGGLGKGQDFAPLAAPVARYVRAVVLIGRDAGLIREALRQEGVPLLDAPDMVQAVALASVQAKAGDAVLMSPACASMDMFKDYAHRAQVFVQAVKDMADEAGQMLEGHD